MSSLLIYDTDRAISRDLLKLYICLSVLISLRMLYRKTLHSLTLSFETNVLLGIISKCTLRRLFDLN